jgi:hypothetical protein
MCSATIGFTPSLPRVVVDGATMLPSLYDHFLVAYEVNCEMRQIKLHAKRDPRIPVANGERTTHTVVFSGVEGYQFENDAFGNIIFSLESVSVAQLLFTYGSQITESHRMTGAPGAWAADLTSATKVLAAKGVRGFILLPRYGLSGWVLAKAALVERK